VCGRLDRALWRAEQVNASTNASFGSGPYVRTILIVRPDDANAKDNKYCSLRLQGRGIEQNNDFRPIFEAIAHMLSIGHGNSLYHNQSPLPSRTIVL
jgi:hypothetical protein